MNYNFMMSHSQRERIRIIFNTVVFTMGVIASGLMFHFSLKHDGNNPGIYIPFAIGYTIVSFSLINLGRQIFSSFGLNKDKVYSTYQQRWGHLREISVLKRYTDLQTSKVQMSSKTLGKLTWNIVRRDHFGKTSPPSLSELFCIVQVRPPWKTVLQKFMPLLLILIFALIIHLFLIYEYELVLQLKDMEEFSARISLAVPILISGVFIFSLFKPPRSNIYLFQRLKNENRGGKFQLIGAGSDFRFSFAVFKAINGNLSESDLGEFENSFMGEFSKP